MFFEGERHPRRATTTRKDIEKYFNRQELRRALLEPARRAVVPAARQRGLRDRAGGARRRRADPGGPLPHRARLRLFERRRWSMPLAAALAAGRVVLDPLRSWTRTSRRSWPPTCRPSRRRPARLVEAMGGEPRRGVRPLRRADRADRRAGPRDPARHRAAPAGRARREALRRRGAGSCCPANVSRVAERIAERHGVQVERAGITQAGLIEAAARAGRDLRRRARRRLRVPRRSSRASTP